MPDGTIQFIDQNNKKDSWERMLEDRRSYAKNDKD